MKLFNRLTGIAFASIILLISILYLVFPDSSYSETENRAFAQLPDFSFSELTSGQYGTDVEQYITDQLPFRSTFVTASADSHRLLGAREINGVYLADDNYLISKYVIDTTSRYQLHENLHYLHSFFTATASAGITDENIYIMAVPPASYVLADLLPAGANTLDADMIMSTLESNFSEFNIIDLRSVLRNAAVENQIFYRTDHHWTTAGAGIAYNSFISAASATYYEQSITDSLTTVSNGFQGSLYSKVMCSNMPYDNVQIFKSDSVTSSVSIGNTVKGSLYDMSYLDKKDKYAVFFGGNYGCVQIKNNSSSTPSGETDFHQISGDNSQKNILILKDSFANCFVPYLVHDYDNITMIDLRYFTGNIKDILQAGNFNDILVLYEMSDLLTDSNFSKLRG